MSAFSRYFDFAEMRVACLFLLLSACNDQFDFDTEPRDAAARETGTADVVSSSDATQPGRVVCGATSCILPTRACCVAQTGSTCIEVSEVPCGDVLVRCDSSNDCTAGHVCCAKQADAGVASVQCRDVASCTSPGDVVLCDPNDATECASCGPTAPPLPPGYYRCF